MLPTFVPISVSAGKEQKDRHLPSRRGVSLPLFVNHEEGNHHHERTL